MYQTILAPLDGSLRAEAILPHVEDLARRYGAMIIFLEVVEQEPFLTGPEPIYIQDDQRHHVRHVAEVEQYLELRQAEFQAKGINTTTRLVEGHSVVEEIIKVAEQENVDLIAMASHGRTGLSQVFYGSVATGVLHRANFPLLLIRSLDVKPK
jgi:nucleotide-binding universal stress UspA family protein